MHSHSRCRSVVVALTLASLVGCSGSAGGGPAGPTGPTGPTGPSETCQGHALAGLAPDHLLLGASGSQNDTVTGRSGFDLQYIYISGGLPDGSGPCASCASGCTALTVNGNGTSTGHSCANSDGCAWWACWQYDQDPPGTQYGSDFATRMAGQGRVPMFTYYMVLQSYRQLHPDPSFREGTDEVTKAATDAPFLARYLADFRLLLQRIGSNRALVHIEPDFWGYAQHAGADPHALSVPVKTANATDCAGQENSIAGLGRCMIAMVRRYAPSATVGLHASAWASGVDVSMNTNSQFDVAAEGTKVGAFLAECGPDADVVVADIADRDAADSGGRWMKTDDTLPSIRQVLEFEQAVAARIGKPIVWWQVPVGNMSLPNAAKQWKDNRLDWFLDNVGEVAQRGAVGVAFGGGQASSTTPDSDGGHLFTRAAAYGTAGGQKLCP